MTLLELLVKELPKRGGWPEGAHYAAQDDDGSIYTFERAPEIDCGEWIDADDSSPAFVSKIGCFNLASDQHEAIITRQQYEAALAASQKVEWDGSYPIKPGTDVEVHFDGDDSRVWTEFRVEYMRGDVVVLYDYHCDDVGAYSNECLNFRPIRCEADKKRKETIDLMDKRFKEVLAAGSTEAMAIFATVYDTIAAGKIPSGHIE